MKEIKLTQGQVTQVSDHRFENLNQYKWQAAWDKKNQCYYVQRGEWLGMVNGKRKMRIIKMAREILGLKHGDKRKGDHKDHNTLNNQDYNLRIAKNDSESNANRRLRSDSTTGYKGVQPRGKRYVASIKKDGKQKYLGTRDTPEEASSLYWAAAQEMHVGFACIA